MKEYLRIYNLTRSILQTAKQKTGIPVPRASYSAAITSLPKAQIAHSLSTSSVLTNHESKKVILPQPALPLADEAHKKLRERAIMPGLAPEQLAAIGIALPTSGTQNSSPRAKSTRFGYFFGTAIGLAIAGFFLEQRPVKCAANDNLDQLEVKEQPKLRIKNFVFQGGGPKGLAYPAALKYLDDKGCLKEVERVAGTSAGAIMAALWAVGYTPTDIEKLLVDSQEQFKRFALDNDAKTDPLTGELLDAVGQPGLIAKGFNLIWACVTNPRGVWNLGRKLVTNRGISSGDFFRAWLTEAISSKVAELETGDINNKNKYQFLTFADLEKLRRKARNEGKGNRYKQLYIVGALYDEKDGPQSYVYSAEAADTKNYVIVDAVRVSMSIPGMFNNASLCYRDEKGDRQEIEALAKRGIDGGVLRNYALELFDYNCYLSEPYADKSPAEEIINPETLGFSLYSNKGVSLPKYIMKVAVAVWQEKKITNSVTNPMPRTVKIETRGITLLDFKLPPEKIKLLRNAGKKGIEDYYQTEAEKLAELQQQIHEEASNTNFALMTEHRKLTNLARHSFAPANTVPSHYERLQPYIDPFLKGLQYLWVTGIASADTHDMAVYTAEHYRKSHFWLSWERRFGKKEQPIIWFVKADTEENWIASCEELLTRLGKTLPPPASGATALEVSKAQEKRRLAIAASFKEALLDHPGWLLILDSTDLLDKSSEFIPTIIDNKGNLLVITHSAKPAHSLHGAIGIDLSGNGALGSSFFDAALKALTSRHGFYAHSMNTEIKDSAAANSLAPPPAAASSLTR